MRRKDREITNITEIESIISIADVCRVAMDDSGIPYIVTMNFGYSGGAQRCFYFHCALEGRKLEMIRKNSFVCFELDIDHRKIEGEEACDFSMDYRSVVGWGNMVIISENEEKRRGLDTILHHYTGRTDFTYHPGTYNRILVLRLEISEMTGKKHISNAGI